MKQVIVASYDPTYYSAIYYANKKKRFANPLVSSLAVGIIPCPVVVMVMLFALSMDMMGLGIILGLTISLGMALTITGVVLVGLSGKAASLSMASKQKKFFPIFEHVIELMAALAVTSLGLVFFFWQIVDTLLELPVM